MRAYVLPGISGVILGRLFHTPRLEDVHEITSTCARQISETGGSHLIRNYWGNYVAIVQSLNFHRTYVIRDPSGRVPCFYTEHRGVYMFFSSLGDIGHLGLRFSVDDRYLAKIILRHPVHVPETGLREIREALAGDCVEISSDNFRQSSLWEPNHVSSEGVIDDYPIALRTLKASTENAIAAWASVYDRILLYLSGGLDSAIVLGCLARLGFASRVVCINHFTEGTRDDERVYARAAAQMAGVSLTELPRVNDGNTFSKLIQRIPFQPKPAVTYPIRMLMINDVNKIAAEFDCDSVWTGQGGDHVFLQRAHPYGAADYLLRHPVPLKLPSVVYDSALLDRDSIWSVLLIALRHRFGVGTNSRLPEESEPNGGAFLTSLAISGINHASYVPWENHSPHLPPGKRLQIRDLANLVNRQRPLIGIERPFEQHPLISQPLLEASLRIPTYHLQRGGRHRAMARDAFVDRVPRCILEREDKGEISNHISAILRGSTQFLSDSLLGGSLVSRGILERTTLERILLCQDTYKITELFPLLSCIAAEMWLRKWETTSFTRKVFPAVVIDDNQTAQSSRHPQTIQRESKATRSY